ncbi:hypothetical protein WDU94_009971 [Cyamophila willieti]
MQKVRSMGILGLLFELSGTASSSRPGVLSYISYFTFSFIQYQDWSWTESWYYVVRNQSCRKSIQNWLKLHSPWNTSPVKVGHGKTTMSKTSGTSWEPRTRVCFSLTWLPWTGLSTAVVFCWE